MGKQRITYTLTDSSDAPTEIGYRFFREGDWTKLRYFPSKNKWIVQKRNGQRLFFQDAVGSPRGTFAWYLTHKEDKYSNSVTYSYIDTGNGRNLYLDEILYTSHPRQSVAPFKIDLVWADNDYSFVVDCSSGYCQGQNGIMQPLDSKYLVGVDVLAYECHPNCEYTYRKGFNFDDYEIVDNQRLLKKTKLYAKKHNEQPTYMPDTTFEYQNPSLFEVATGVFSLGDYWWEDVQVGAWAGAGVAPSSPEYSKLVSSGDAWYSKQLRAFIDMNGDGVVDIVENTEESRNFFKVSLGQVDSSGRYSIAKTIPDWGPVPTGNCEGAIKCVEQSIDIFQTGSYHVTRNDLIDVNGDGRPDLVGHGVAINDGSGFVAGGDWQFGYLAETLVQIDTLTTYPQRRHEKTDIQVVDFNGDGLVDIVDLSRSKSYIYLNNGNDFDDAIEISFPVEWLNYRVTRGDYKSDTSYDLISFLDVNGDGMPDIVKNECFDDLVACSDRAGNLLPWKKQLVVYYNVGDSFTAPVALHTPSGMFLAPVAEYKHVENGDPEHTSEICTAMMMDFNGDGFADYLNGNKLRMGNHRAFGDEMQIDELSGNGALGHSYTYPEIPGNSFPYFIESHNLWRDVNGDGRLDRLSGIQGHLTTNPKVWMDLPEYAPAFLMTKSYNGKGSDTSITYKPASATQDSSIPYPMDVVSRTNTWTNSHTGTKQTGDTHYLYSGGQFVNWDYSINDVVINPGAMEFRGFAEVVVEDWDEDVSVTTRYHQRHRDVGMPESSTTSRRSTGEVFSRVSYEYEMISPDGISIVPRDDPRYPDGTHWPGPRFNAPVFQKTETCEGQTNCTTQGVRYSYSNIVGLVKTVHDYGKCLEQPPTCEEYKRGHRAQYLYYKYDEDLAEDSWIVDLAKAESHFWTAPDAYRKEMQIQLFHDGSDNESVIDKGAVTKVQRFTGQGIFGEKLLTYYSDYGVLETETEYDKDLHTEVQYTYDDYYMYIASSLIPSSPFFESYETDLVTGLRYLTVDSNGTMHKATQYDGFGRVLESAWQHPTGDPGWKWTVQREFHDLEYQNTGNPVFSIIRKNIDEGEGLVSLDYTFYDGDGKALQSSSRHDGLNVLVNHLEYDLRGRLLHTFEPQLTNEFANPWEMQPLPSSADKTIYEYDLLGRVEKIWKEHPDLPRTFTYGNDLSVTMDEPGPKVKTIGDGWGNIEKVVRGPGSLDLTTTYEYDSHNKIIKVVDPDGNELNYQRNWLGQVRQFIQIGGTSWTFEYDYNGLPTYSRSPAGRRVYFYYDGYKRLSTRVFTLNGIPDGTVTYSYDCAPHYGIGRLCLADSEAGSVSYDYDPLGRVVERGQLSSSSSHAYSMSYNYNPAGQVKRFEFPDGDAYLKSYYPDGSELSLSRESDGFVVGRAFYDTWRAPFRVETQGGVNYTTYRDGWGKTSQIVTKTGGSTPETIMNMAYMYYPSDRIQARGDIGPEHELEQFIYDDAGRLSQWLLNGELAEDYSFSQGASTSPKLHSIMGTMADFNLGYDNTTFPWAVTSRTDVSSGTTVSYEYDSDGRLISQGSLFKETFTYGALGLLRKSALLQFLWVSLGLEMLVASTPEPVKALRASSASLRPCG